MFNKFEKLLSANLLNNVYVVGFLSNTDNNSAEFSTMLDFIYFEFEEQMVEFQSVEQYSKLRISFVDRVRFEFDKLENDMFAKVMSVN